MSTTLLSKEKQIARIQRALAQLGPMRPGALGHQYKDPKEKRGGYWQISYTRGMKSRTEYVRRECVTALRREVQTHKRFKRLVDRWVELSIERSRLTMQTAEPATTR